VIEWCYESVSQPSFSDVLIMKCLYHVRLNDVVLG